MKYKYTFSFLSVVEFSNSILTLKIFPWTEYAYKETVKQHNDLKSIIPYISNVFSS